MTSRGINILTAVFWVGGFSAPVAASASAGIFLGDAKLRL